MNVLFNPRDGSTLFSLEKVDVWLFKFGIEMAMTEACTQDEMVVPVITKKFLNEIERRDLPRIKFDATFLAFVIGLIGEIMSEMDEEEIDVDSLSKMLFAMDEWLVGEDYLGTATVQ